jgi:acyl carrier protein
MPYDEQKLTDVFRTIFNLPALELRDDLTARDVPGWDSFNHVNLVIAIETEFGVVFDTDEIAALENVGQMKALLKSKF